MIAPSADIASREMSIGRVFERAVTTILRNPASVLLLALLFGGLPNLGFQYGMVELERILGDDPNPPVMVTEIAIGFFLLGNLTSLAQAVLTRVVVAGSKGDRAGMVASVGAAARAAPAWIPASLLTSAGITVGLVLFVVPGAFLWVLWCVAIPVMIEERIGLSAALRRSSELTKDVRWNILALLLVLLGIDLAVTVAVEVVTGEWQSTDSVAALRDPTYVAVLTLGNTLLTAFSATVIAALYVELRDSKEGPTAARLEEVFG